MPARRYLWTVIILLMLVLYTASSGVDLLVDFIWYDSVDYISVFATVFLAKVIIGVLGGVTAFGLVFLNLALALREVGDPTRYLPPEIAASPLGAMLSGRTVLRWVLVFSLAIGLLAGLAAVNNWQGLLFYYYGGEFGALDPIFQKDNGFYIFQLPFFDSVRSFLWTIGVLSLLGVGFLFFLKLQAERAEVPGAIDLSSISTRGRLHLGLLGAFLLLVMAAGLYLDRFMALHEPGGLFAGPGYSDIHGTIPVLALKAVAAIVAGGILVFALLRQRYRFLIGAAGLLVVVWIGGNIYTTILQRFVVAPNELEKERPYLAHHIAATNRAFALDKVLERPLTEETELTARNIQANRATINNVRLWDHEPLLDTFSQIQEIRTYYDFVSVDNDRYRINGELRQTMLSPRELNNKSLPSRTWVNERLTFTHGYGLTLGPVNRVNEQGLPRLFVQDLPPRSDFPELAIKEPAIYYGEVVDDYVFVRTNQKEFNYPEGEKNIFSTYQGKGGISLPGFWKRLLFAIHLRDVKILLADDFTEETRILMIRNIKKRVRKIAPMVLFDEDPYLVIHNGELVWIYDGYTVSDAYPYSQQVADLGNYMRNPIKAVINAHDGSVTFYLVDPEDPIAAAYGRMFPGFFRPISDMPRGLVEHLRHPQDYFSVQTHMYTVYHMRDVNTFYNKEDLWEVPVIDGKRMQPYYTVMKLPGEKEEEFILMLPFTPSRKDNLAAWMVARMDGKNYGKLLVYTFPKQTLVFGPKQMVARINQDAEVSQQITLWDQSGSNVIRGTLLVIPIENSLIYIQPLYLKAENGRIPELKRVIVGYQNSIAMGIDLEDALTRIFGGATTAQQPRAVQAAGQPPGTPAVQAETRAAGSARRHYEAMLKASQEGDWARFGREIEALGQELRKLEQKR